MNATLLMNLVEAYAPKHVVEKVRIIRKAKDTERQARELAQATQGELLDALRLRREIDEREFVEPRTNRLPVNGRAFAAAPDA
jgi:hypothetical protein